MNDCRGQLLERVRQGGASSDDHLAFEAHLGLCESCRLTWQIGSAFDRVGVAKHDGATVARLAAAVLERTPPGALATDGAVVLRMPEGSVRTRAGSQASSARARGRGRSLRQVLLAALAFSGVAMAGIWTWSAAIDSDVAPAASVHGASTRAADDMAPAVHSSATVAETPGAEASSVGKPTEASSNAALAVAAPSSAAKDNASSASASVLFKQANDARRAGQRPSAVKLYRELQRQFPTSAEATLSRVSLGGLLLDQGQAKAALEQFDAYLRLGPNRQLTAEALYGRGRALRSLGQRRQEVLNWRQLLRVYPGSPYSSEAQRRLQALDAN
jgi:TolA-binding protein